VRIIILYHPNPARTDEVTSFDTTIGAPYLTLSRAGREGSYGERIRMIRFPSGSCEKKRLNKNRFESKMHLIPNSVTLSSLHRHNTDSSISPIFNRPCFE